ncbi:MAG: sigma-54-dependent Fis family transcriptional regulator [Elusimicrobia bacterium]|nr:sigma-54-dependent Fis family transcriptional regulator [Elusimicrobiota bacterium]
MSKLSILVVEDDALARKVMAAELKSHSVEFAETAAAARKRLAAAEYDLVFLDLELGPKDACSGLTLIAPAVARGAYAVVMSGHDSEEVVERAYELGCHDVYAKGSEGESVARVLARFARHKDLPETERLFTNRFVTQDPETRQAVLEALKYAASDLPLLILGPSGTGKTSLARVLHEQSGRSGSFVAVNCAAYTEDLLEAELFGYRRGAFTGADGRRKGRLLEADGGTLFLDEIGAMSLSMQSKLLKAVEERQFYPLGSDRPETSSFRVMSATLEDLPALVKAGRLRFDFFQRIHGMTVALKPLARRPADAAALIAHFTRAGRRLSFTAQAKERLGAHSWPGNIRELKRFVDLVTAGHEGRVSAEAVEGLLAQARTEPPKALGEAVTDEQYRYALEHGLNAAVDRLVDAAVARCLAENNGKKTKVLSELKVSTRLLYSSLERSGAGGA